MKIQSNISWLSDFVDSVNDLVPLKRINRITGYSVPIGKEEKQYASITKFGRKFNINLLLKYQTPFSQTHKRTYLATLLDSLAHELAHAKTGFNHCPKHFELQARILLRFSKVLKRLGVKNTYGRIRL